MKFSIFQFNIFRHAFMVNKYMNVYLEKANARYNFFMPRLSGDQDFCLDRD